MVSGFVMVSGFILSHVQQVDPLFTVDLKALFHDGFIMYELAVRAVALMAEDVEETWEVCHLHLSWTIV